MTNEILRKAVPGEEVAIHDAHMRSIREVCVKDHGQEEIRGWGNRPLGNRWTESIVNGDVWVVESDGKIEGVGCIKVTQENEEKIAELMALYLTPKVISKGFGKHLCDILLDQVKNINISRVILNSSLTAREFYKMMGFIESGPITKVIIGGYPVSSIPMFMNLTNSGAK